MYKIIGADGKEYGPISTAQLRQWLNEGRVNSQTKVQPEGAADWQPLSALPEFAAELGKTSPAGMAPPPRVVPQTSGYAIGSVVCGALGFLTCLTAPVGLVLGLMAKSRIRQSQGALTGSSMATTGIVLSAVAMVLTLLLIIPAALLLPALSKAKERAQTISCVNNVKQLALGVRMYAVDNDDRFPSAANWSDAIQNYLGSPRPYQCAADQSLRCAFAYNQKLDGLKDDEINPQTVLFFESSTGWNAAGGPELFDAHKHSRARIVVGFADGSVQQLPRSQLETLRWEP